MDSATSEAAGSLQDYARAELCQRLEFFTLQPECVLDLGAASRQDTLELARRFPRARTIALDLRSHKFTAAPRWSWWRRRRYERVCANADALPLADGCCDLIFSNLTLPCCERPHELLAQLRRLLRPGGLLLFSSFAPDTLQELRAAWASVDTGPHVSEFAALPLLGESLVRSGFIEPVIDVERQRRHYPSLQAVKRELRHIGAQKGAPGRPNGLGGRARTVAMCAAYDRAREAKGLPVTWELLFGAAFAGSERPQPATGGVEHLISLDRVRRRGRSSGSAAQIEP